MGYFSKLSLERFHQYHDNSYVSPEEQLLYRLEDLYARRTELADMDYTYDDRTCWNDAELRYAPPRYLNTQEDVQAAIAIAIDELAVRYGIFVMEEPEKVTPVMDEITNAQISFADFLSMPRVA